MYSNNRLCKSLNVDYKANTKKLSLLPHGNIQTLYKYHVQNVF